MADVLGGGADWASSHTSMAKVFTWADKEVKVNTSHGAKRKYKGLLKPAEKSCDPAFPNLIFPKTSVKWLVKGFHTFITSTFPFFRGRVNVGFFFSTSILLSEDLLDQGFSAFSELRSVSGCQTSEDHVPRKSFNCSETLGEKSLPAIMKPNSV